MLEENMEGLHGTPHQRTGKIVRAFIPTNRLYNLHPVGIQVDDYLYNFIYFQTSSVQWNMTRDNTAALFEIKDNLDSSKIYHNPERLSQRYVPG